MKFRRFLLSSTILFIMFMIILNPARYLESLRNGLILFWSAVLPALFPFFFFTKILSSIGFPESVSKVFKRPVRFLFGAPDISSYIFFMSIISGYPIGAKLTAEYYNAGIIDEEDAKKIVTFCSTSAPLFIIGTLGTFMLSNPKYGVIILISHYISVIISGLIFCNIRRKKPKNSAKILNYNVSDDAITNSVISILSVGGLIAIFSLIIDIFSDIGFFDLFGKYSFIPIGIIEMTRGSLVATTAGLSTPLLLGVLTGFVSFSGISIIIQAMTFLKSAKIKPLYYLFVKSFQGVLGALIAYFIGLLI